MKAVILAGGEGTRLRPLSCHKPKPMVHLLEKPVLEHIIIYLRRFGVTDICATLQTMPYTISDYFGDGTAHGVRMTYMLENKPLGTAGSVRACREFLGDDDFLVVSGDAVLDLDLAPAFSLHKDRGSLATLVLHRQSKLLEYGLVMTDDAGRVIRFIEKPSWGQVFCDTVNTGLYVLHPSVMDLVPEHEFYDFARDLFPVLLQKQMRMFGQACDGYWCDMGDADAFRQCTFDALDGKVHLSLPEPVPGRRLWAQSPLPEDARIIPPCFIGKDVYIGHGVTIGPHAAIYGSSFIGDRAVVRDSVLEGVQLDADTNVSGAIAGHGSVLRRGSILCEGAVLGENVIVGEHAMVQEGARVWPGKEIEPGAHVSGSLTAGQRRRQAVFDGQGRISGQPNVDITPDFCLHLGAACAELSSEGPVGLGYWGGEAARVAALALETGVCAAGGRVVLHNAPTPASAAFAALSSLWPLSLFVCQQAGRLDIHCFEPDGMPLRHIFERKLDGAVARGELPLVHAAKIGGHTTDMDIGGAYVAEAVSFGGQKTDHSLSLSVPGEHPSAKLLRAVLSAMGCHVSAVGGLPLFSIDRDGFSLTAVDEQGKTLPVERLQAIMTKLCWTSGQTTVALPYNAPATLDLLSAQYGGTLLRLGRDGDEARRQLSAQPQFRDGIFAATFLCAHMKRTGVPLYSLSETLPPFAVSVAEVGLHGDRGAVMRSLARSHHVEAAELFDGLRARVEGGWVHIAPLPGRRALRIIGEAASEEMAAELCAEFRSRTRSMDRAAAGEE